METPTGKLLGVAHFQRLLREPPSTLVSSIQGETEQARKQMELWTDRSASFGEEGQSAKERMQALLDLSTRMELTIETSALRSFVEVAKIDHLVYKFELYKVFMRQSDKTVADFADHTQCRLGKWYYQGNGKALYSSLPGYREMETPHQRFHDAGLAAMRAHQDGNWTETFAQIEALEAASLDVLADHALSPRCCVERRPPAGALQWIKYLPPLPVYAVNRRLRVDAIQREARGQHGNDVGRSSEFFHRLGHSPDR